MDGGILHNHSSHYSPRQISQKPGLASVVRLHSQFALGDPHLCRLRPESWVFCQPCICVGSGSEDDQILALTPEQ